MHVVTQDAYIPKHFKGVDLLVGAIGETTMVTLMTFKKGQTVGKHSHPHEQCGYCLRGSFELTAGGRTVTIRPGDSYAIPGNEEHSYVILEDADAVETFTPLRKDYLP